MPTLHDHFTRTGNEILDRRAERYRAITTPQQLAELQGELRGIAADCLGEIVLSQIASDAAPPVIRAGQIPWRDLVIEKFLFEPLPGLRVPAVLYRPARASGRHPAMVFPVGHWWDGKAHHMYQRFMRLLASRGVICASFDSAGQGERVEPFSPVVREQMSRLLEEHPADKPRPFPLADAATHGFLHANNVTSAHCLLADPGYLCGLHLNAITAATGKRLVDLLIARKDVDPQRIGVCGASGGGTDSRFIQAIDPRIALAAPTSIVSNDRSLTGGDADQSLFHSVARGISQIDLLILVAPRPLALVSSTDDEHDPSRPAGFYRHFWDIHGKGENIISGVGEGPHGFPRPTRKLLGEFILKHLAGDTNPIADAEHSDDIPLLPESALYVTPTGNVNHDRASLSMADLAARRAEHLAKTRAALDDRALRSAIFAKLAESEDSISRPAANVEQTDEAITWTTEGDVPVRIVKSGGAIPDLLFLHEYGSPKAEKLREVELLRQSYRVGLLDVRGAGSSATPGNESKNAMLAPLLTGKQAALARLLLHQGRTLPGVRVADCLQAAGVVRSLATSSPSPLTLFADGGIGLIALLALHLEPDAFDRVILYRTPISWHELATGAGRGFNFAHFVFNVLERFDTPDLTRSLPAGKLVWINPAAADGSAIPLAQARRIHRSSAIDFRHVRTLTDLARLQAAPRARKVRMMLEPPMPSPL